MKGRGRDRKDRSARRAAHRPPDRPAGRREPGGEASIPGERREGGPLQFLAIGVLSAAILVALCGAVIEGQGLHYDEVWAFPASCLILGKPRYTFVTLAWGDFPLLTLPYVGAVKSYLYALWAAVSGMPFSVASWRFTGIVTTAAGLVAFCALAGRALGRAGLAAFLVLFLTDTTVLSYTRFDFGPVAFPLALRLLWLGIWLRGEFRASPGPGGAFLLGLIPAFSIYEKLNNYALVAPLGVVALGGRGAPAKRIAAMAAGFLVGLLPFVAVNLLADGISFRTAGNAVNEAGAPGHGIGRLAAFLADYLALGGGYEARKFMFNPAIGRTTYVLEALFALGMLAVIAALFAKAGRRDSHARPMALAAASYLLIGLLCFAMPRETGPHHWIVGTPFQYVAAALAVPLVKERFFPDGWTWRPTGRSGAAVLVAAALFLASRGYAVAGYAGNVINRDAGPMWDRSYTTVAEFAVRHREEGTFIAADWGLATQIYSLSNGEFPVAEPIWSWGYGWTPWRLRAHMAERPDKPVYVLLRRNEKPIYPLVTEDIVRTVVSITGGRTLPLEPELAGLKEVRVIKLAPPE